MTSLIVLLAKYVQSSKPADPGHESSSSSDDEEDYIEISPELLKKVQNKGTRTSVSAEAYGIWNQKGTYKPKVVPKTEDQKDRIRKRLSQAFMFQALDEKEQQIVVDAMEEVQFPYFNTQPSYVNI